MSKRLFITGTSTAIGKTYISSLICKKLNRIYSVAYYKAAMSGSGNFGHGEKNLMAQDAFDVKYTADLIQNIDDMCRFVYKHPFSPHLCAVIEKNPFNMDEAVDGFFKMDKRYKFTVIEGTGGIICPLSIDKDKKELLPTFIKKIDAPVLIVADSGLGTINHTYLTYYYLKKHGFKIKAVILNNFDETNLVHLDNLKTLKEITTVSKFFYVKKDQEDLHIPIETLVELFE